MGMPTLHSMHFFPNPQLKDYFLHNAGMCADQNSFLGLRWLHRAPHSQHASVASTPVVAQFPSVPQATSQLGPMPWLLAPGWGNRNSESDNSGEVASAKPPTSAPSEITTPSLSLKFSNRTTKKKKCSSENTTECVGFRGRQIETIEN